MDSKRMILDAVRRSRPNLAELPSVQQNWSTYADPQAKFIEVLELLGGYVRRAADAHNLNCQLADLPYVASAQRTVSLIAGVGPEEAHPLSLDSTHELADVDVAILPGEFGVAENAAVWVTDRFAQPRVLFFLCQHLILVVPARQVVNNMHEAYERLVHGGKSDERHAASTENVVHGHYHPWGNRGFGAFISGPSKTADIEQSLVIGAHGPRSLTVCLLGG